MLCTDLKFRWEFPKYKIGLLGYYQNRNIKGVLATLKELVDFKIDEQHIIQGLENVVENTGLMLNY